MNVFVRPVEGGEVTRVTSETARDIYGVVIVGGQIEIDVEATAALRDTKRAI